MLMQTIKLAMIWDFFILSKSEVKQTPEDIDKNNHKYANDIENLNERLGL